MHSKCKINKAVPLYVFHNHHQFSTFINHLQNNNSTLYDRYSIMLCRRNSHLFPNLDKKMLNFRYKHRIRKTQTEIIVNAIQSLYIYIYISYHFKML